jgi:hypothetical protein
VTVLNPNPHITGISIESLPIELSGKLPPPLISSMIGKIDEILLPAEARHVNGAAQPDFTPIKDSPARLRSSRWFGRICLPLPPSFSAVDHGGQPRAGYRRREQYKGISCAFR